VSSSRRKAFPADEEFKAAERAVIRDAEPSTAGRFPGLEREADRLAFRGMLSDSTLTVKHDF
jgi:hypothetical protein